MLFCFHLAGFEIGRYLVRLGGSGEAAPVGRGDLSGRGMAARGHRETHGELHGCLPSSC